MADLFTSGLVVNAILAITVLEGVALTVLWWLSGRGLAPGKLWPNLLAGIALLLALRGAQGGAAWPWLPACLCAAGLSHVLDLRQRWR